MEVDQSALTGESLPAEKKPGDAVFSGSIIRQGEIEAMVYATGTDTYFGKTAQMVQGPESASHFQKAVLKIGDYLILLAVALVALIVTVALFRHDPVMGLSLIHISITTAFDMRVQNDLDRFHLVQDVVDRVPHLGSRGAYLKQTMQDKLIEHKQYRCV